MGGDVLLVDATWPTWKASIRTRDHGERVWVDRFDCWRCDRETEFEVGELAFLRFPQAQCLTCLRWTGVTGPPNTRPDPPVACRTASA